MAGLTSTGFDIMTIDQLLSEFEATELSLISASLDVTAPSPIGVVNGIMALQLNRLWQLGQALYNGMDPDQAADDQLTSLALLTGTVREDATKTQVLAVDVNLNAGVTLPAGSQASIVGNPAAIFVSKADATNSGGAPATIDVDFEALNAGPIQCLASTLTVIAVPVTGWNSVTNPTDGTIGKDIETDAALRTRRESDLSAAGATTASAIRADVMNTLQTPTTTVSTTGCTVLFNDSDATDSNGLPPHSIEVIALAAGATSNDNQLLADLILAQKAAGIQTYGTSSKTATDSQGFSETIYYTRPAATALTVVITVLTDPAFTVTSDAVKAALIAHTAEYQPGVDVYWRSLMGSVFPNPADALIGVPGVLDVTVFTVNGAAANITIDVRHIATLATGGITVTVI